MRDSVPAISVTKPPAPLPVALPTPHDIAPLPSPPESDDDLEAGRGHENELSLAREDYTENIGLVTSTRKGKSKSPIRREGTDGTMDSMLPLPPTPRSSNDLITPMLALSQDLHSKKSYSTALPGSATAVQVLTSTNTPDLLMDSTPSNLSSAPPLKPSLSSGHAKDLKLELPTSSDAVGNQEEAHTQDAELGATTIRLIGGGGETGVSESPVEANTGSEVKETEPEPSPPVYQGTTTESSSTPAAVPNKDHKKSKNSLVNLKRFSVGTFGRKKDSVSSVKDAHSR